MTGFDRFPAQLQYTFCNAEKVYAHLRGAWQNANVQQRAANYACLSANSGSFSGRTVTW